MPHSLKDQVAIVGVGQTEYSRGSGVSTRTLGVWCAQEAMLDAGLAPAEIDGMILFYLQEPLECADIARMLGTPELRWQLNVYGGGNNGGHRCSRYRGWAV